MGAAPSVIFRLIAAEKVWYVLIVVARDWLGVVFAQVILLATVHLGAFSSR